MLSNEQAKAIKHLYRCGCPVIELDWGASISTLEHAIQSRRDQLLELAFEAKLLRDYADDYPRQVKWARGVGLDDWRDLQRLGRRAEDEARLAEQALRRVKAEISLLRLALGVMQGAPGACAAALAAEQPATLRRRDVVVLADDRPPPIDPRPRPYWVQSESGTVVYSGVSEEDARGFACDPHHIDSYGPMQVVYRTNDEE